MQVISYPEHEYRLKDKRDIFHFTGQSVKCLFNIMRVDDIMVPFLENNNFQIITITGVTLVCLPMMLVFAVGSSVAQRECLVNNLQWSLNIAAPILTKLTTNRT